MVHDILWHFMSAISNHPMITAATQAKEEAGDDDEDKVHTRILVCDLDVHCLLMIYFRSLKIGALESTL